jgi:hypothetical protein
MPFNVILVLWAASAPVVFALLAIRATTKGGRVGAWGGCLAALGTVGLMAIQFFFLGGRKDAQGVLALFFGPAFAWAAALLVACSLWLGAWLLSLRRGRRLPPDSLTRRG